MRNHPKPLILLASNEAWQVRELKSALLAAGFRVVTTRDERETLDEAQNHQPHGILLDVGVAPPGYGLCRTLRTFSVATPIILTSPGQPTRDEHLEAVRAGAWELRGVPVDVEDLLLRLEAYVEAKVELDRVSEDCLVDRISGLYNHLGLTRRATELAALAARHGLALACVVFRPAEKLPTRAAGDRLGRAFKSVGRLSDAIGRTGQSEFAVFAPATNAWAAAKLMQRMRDQVSLEAGYMPERGQRVTLRSAYSTALPSQKVEAKTLLERARNALESTPA